MAPLKRAETCSCEIWREISFNNICLIEICVRLYIIYIYIYITVEARKLGFTSKS